MCCLNCIDWLLIVMMCQFEQVSPSPTPITILAIGNCYLWAGYLFSNAKARCKPESKVACHRSNPLHRLRQVFFNVHFSWIIFLGFTYSWSVSHRFLIPLDHDTSHDPWPWPWIAPWSAKGKSCKRKEGRTVEKEQRFPISSPFLDALASLVSGLKCIN